MHVFNYIVTKVSYLKGNCHHEKPRKGIFTQKVVRQIFKNSIFWSKNSKIFWFKVKKPNLEANLVECRSLWCKSVNIPTVPKYTEDAAAIASVEPSMVPAKVSPLIFAPSAVRALTVLTLDFRANKDPIVFSTLENSVHIPFICVSDTFVLIINV